MRTDVYEEPPRRGPQLPAVANESEKLEETDPGPDTPPPGHSLVELGELGDEEWEGLVSRARGVAALANAPMRQSADIYDLADLCDVHPATIWRDLKKFREGRGEIRDIAPKKGGFPRGRSRLDGEQERIIQHYLLTSHASLSRPSMMETWLRIGDICEDAGLGRPSRATIIRRWNRIKKVQRKRWREGAEAAERITPMPGRHLVPHPWDEYQIDHTLADVILVDSVYRKPIGRPWLTLVMDVCTRMVAGFYVSLEPPSLLRAAIAMDLAVQDKTEWLEARGLDYAWPIMGLCRRVLSDRAAEFRSRIFRRALENQNVTVRLRRRKHHGGHIERLIGTMMGSCRMLPGATFNSPAARGEYDSKASARLTLQELETWFAHRILGEYHSTPHAGLGGLTPLEAWRAGIADRVPRMPSAPENFRFDLFPEEPRIVSRTGIRAFCETYNSTELMECFAAGLRDVAIKYDPRNLRQLYVDIDPPRRRYIEVPLVWPETSSVSTLWLYHATRRSGASVQPTRNRTDIRAAQARMAEVVRQAHGGASIRSNRQAERFLQATKAVPLHSNSVTSVVDLDEWDADAFGDDQ